MWGVLGGSGFAELRRKSEGLFTLVVEKRKRQRGRERKR